ncbi:MAG TPA: DUF6600 domain-containing protein [Pseudacidobacterium sp.]|jgi:hypothetical protein|nr:DUF6600 domain-containing protein [Pseudacidobacterium sp.]
MWRLEGWQSRFFLSLFSPLFLAFALTAFSSAQENNNVRSVRISHVDGTVQLLDSNGMAFDKAQPNMPVTQGMRIKTGEDGRVEVQFEDGSVARATPNSVINFDKLERTSEGKTVTQIVAESGLSYYEFNNRGGTYAVHFGPYTVTASKSSIFRLGLDENPAQVAVMHGTIHIDTGNDGGLDIQTSQTASLNMDDASSYDIAQNITADSWDQWNSDRDQVLEKMGSRATMARALSGNPNDPAWSDLDYYGNWYDMPGYGMGWMPAGVGAGWDPFGSGYWGYYPTYGYSWISAYPWGWWPYRCGAWNWFGGAGWMWFPGNCGWGSGWYPVTIWNYPPGYVIPLRPKPITPVRGPVHMPPQQALIAVNHNPRNSGTSLVEGNKPVATPIKFDGKTIHPIETTVRPLVSGPLGQSFETSSGYVPPKATVVEGWRGNSARDTGVPSRGSAPTPVYRPAPRNTMSGGGAPHYSAPPPAPMPRMSAPPPPPPSAPAPSAGGSRPH